MVWQVATRVITFENENVCGRHVGGLSQEES
jgi:hypothetical protein